MMLHILRVLTDSKNSESWQKYIKYNENLKLEFEVKPNAYPDKKTICGYFRKKIMFSALS